MTEQKKQERIKRFMPGGIPRWIRAYDNGGTDVEDGSIDRYTVVFTGRFPKTDHHFPYLAMNARPFHPQGFGQHGTTQFQPADWIEGRWGGVDFGRKCHLGRRIRFEDLPDDCKTLVLRDYRDLWSLN